MAIKEYHASDEVFDHTKLCKNLWHFLRPVKVSLTKLSDAPDTIAQVVTSSSAAEVCFSFYEEALFWWQKESALEDLWELSSMLHYTLSLTLLEANQ